MPFRRHDNEDPPKQVRINLFIKQRSSQLKKYLCYLVDGEIILDQAILTEEELEEKNHEGEAPTEGNIAWAMIEPVG
jgi:hypothetical protein